jgi:hypothetical protein
MVDVTATEVTAFQNLVAAIPAGQGVYDAFTTLHVQNPNMTPAHVMSLAQAMIITIGVGESITPAVPVKVGP